MTISPHRTIRLLLAALAVSFAPFAEAKEVLVHEGPSVSVPGLGTLGPNGTQIGEAPDINYVKQFYTDEKNVPAINYDPQAKGLPVITAARAAELALASMEEDYEKGIPIVTKIETFPELTSGVASIQYFLITINVKGSEEHRVVLMNETVVRSRLKRLD
jgi:hypothetical protein